MTAPDPRSRSLPFSSFSHPRDLWWHRLPRSNYLPPIYASPTDEDWRVFAVGFERQRARILVGEWAVPSLRWCTGLAWAAVFSASCSLEQRRDTPRSCSGFSCGKCTRGAVCSHLRSTSGLEILP